MCRAPPWTTTLYLTHLLFTTTPVHWYPTHFTEEKIESLRCELSGPGSHEQVPKPSFKPRVSRES